MKWRKELRNEEKKKPLRVAERFPEDKHGSEAKGAQPEGCAPSPRPGKISVQNFANLKMAEIHREFACLRRGPQAKYLSVEFY